MTEDRFVLQANDIVAENPPEYRCTQADRPADWFDVIDLVSRRLGGKPAEFDTCQKLLYKKNVTQFGWGPSISILFAALLKKRVVYLCWGLPSSSLQLVEKLKIAKLRLILKKAFIILVNEEQTQADVQRLTGRDAAVIPYVVDPDYFCYEPYEKRDDYVLVPGNNDRDEELVIALARSGRRVIRMTRDRKVFDMYRAVKLDGLTLELRYNEPIGVVRQLYQKASVVALPVTGDKHAAGQTAMLEALSCGVPVVLSEGRAAAIVEGFSSVYICTDNAIIEWQEKIEKSILAAKEAPDTLRLVSDRIRQHHSPEVVAGVVCELLSGY